MRGPRNHGTELPRLRFLNPLRSGWYTLYRPGAPAAIHVESKAAETSGRAMRRSGCHRATFVSPSLQVPHHGSRLTPSQWEEADHCKRAHPDAQIGTENFFDHLSWAPLGDRGGNEARKVPIVALSGRPDFWQIFGKWSLVRE